jgi:hypothetical protein
MWGPIRDNGVSSKNEDYNISGKDLKNWRMEVLVLGRGTRPEDRTVLQTHAIKTP